MLWGATDNSRISQCSRVKLMIRILNAPGKTARYEILHEPHCPVCLRTRIGDEPMGYTREHLQFNNDARALIRGDELFRDRYRKALIRSSLNNQG